MSYFPPIKTIDLLDAPIVIWDQLKSFKARLTINGNRTLQIVNPHDGDSYLHVTQGAAGNFTLGYDASIQWAAGTAPDVTEAAGAETKIHFISDGLTVTGNTLFDAQ